MSAYSTLSITRSKAVRMMLDKLTGGVTDAELEQFLDRELEPRLYNALIVNNDEPNDDELL